MVFELSVMLSLNSFHSISTSVSTVQSFWYLLVLFLFINTLVFVLVTLLYWYHISHSLVTSYINPILHTFTSIIITSSHTTIHTTHPHWFTHLIITHITNIIPILCNHTSSIRIGSITIVSLSLIIHFHLNHPSISTAISIYRKDQ